MNTGGEQETGTRQQGVKGRAAASRLSSGRSPQGGGGLPSSPSPHTCLTQAIPSTHAAPDCVCVVLRKLAKHHCSAAHQPPSYPSPQGSPAPPPPRSLPSLLHRTCEAAAGSLMSALSSRMRRASVAGPHACRAWVQASTASYTHTHTTHVHAHAHGLGARGAEQGNTGCVLRVLGPAPAIALLLLARGLPAVAAAPSRPVPCDTAPPRCPAAAPAPRRSPAGAMKRAVVRITEPLWKCS